jgi:hypothetical protein
VLRMQMRRRSRISRDGVSLPQMAQCRVDTARRRLVRVKVWCVRRPMAMRSAFGAKHMNYVSTISFMARKY